ncbi:MAG: hypothetical protein NTW29_22355 [Bacteroidetes bacterium]|nr:hypothetical protein [Bacteroidota bacterium]
MKKRRPFHSGFLFVASLSFVRQNVGIGTMRSDSTAPPDLKSTGKGLLIPRMTRSQRMTIVNRAGGLQVFQTDIPVLLTGQNANLHTGAKPGGSNGSTTTYFVSGVFGMQINWEHKAGGGSGSPCIFIDDTKAGNLLIRSSGGQVYQTTGTDWCSHNGSESLCQCVIRGLLF